MGEVNPIGVILVEGYISVAVSWGFSGRDAPKSLLIDPLGFVGVVLLRPSGVSSYIKAAEDCSDDADRFPIFWSVVFLSASTVILSALAIVTRPSISPEFLQPSLADYSFDFILKVGAVIGVVADFAVEPTEFPLVPSVRI